MKPYPMFALAVAVLAAPGVALADPGVKIEAFAGRLVVIPEARGDVRVDLQRGDPRTPMPVTRREGDTIVVDGGLAGRIGACGVFGIGSMFGGAGRQRVQRVDIRGIGPLTLDRLPVITAHVPMHAAVAAEGAVFGRVGRTERLALSNSGCGDWTVDDVHGDFALAAAGSGDVGAGRAGALHAALSGSGDLTAGDVAGDMDVAVHGSADTKVGRVGGRLRIDLAGSGDLRAREVDGPIQSQQSGSGGVEIAGGPAAAVQVHTSGSGDFTFDGDAGSVAVATSGSGDVSIAHASGPVSQTHSGSGDIHIGH